MVSIFAGTRGYLDDIPVVDVRRCERELLEFMRTRNASLLDELRTGGIPDALAGVVESFKTQFTSAAAAAGRAVDPTATDAAELGEAASQKTLATE